MRSVIMFLVIYCAFACNRGAPVSGAKAADAAGAVADEGTAVYDAGGSGQAMPAAAAVAAVDASARKGPLVEAAPTHEPEVVPDDLVAQLPAELRALHVQLEEARRAIAEQQDAFARLRREFDRRAGFFASRARALNVRRQRLVEAISAREEHLRELEVSRRNAEEQIADATEHLGHLRAELAALPERPAEDDALSLCTPRSALSSALVEVVNPLDGQVSTVGLGSEFAFVRMLETVIGRFRPDHQQKPPRTLLWGIRVADGPGCQAEAFFEDGASDDKRRFACENPKQSQTTMWVGGELFEEMFWKFFADSVPRSDLARVRVGYGLKVSDITGFCNWYVYSIP